MNAFCSRLNRALLFIGLWHIPVSATLIRRRTRVSAAPNVPVLVDTKSVVAQKHEPLVPVVASEPSVRAVKKPDNKHFKIAIRVLLHEHKSPSSVSWTLRSPRGFILLQDASHGHTIIGDQVTIVVRNNKIWLNGVKLTGTVALLKPVADTVSYNGVPFKGAFAVTVTATAAYLVNHIDLEDYVECVLPAETWPGWSDESNKALCIVIRTYGIGKVLDARRMHRKKNIHIPYDINNTQFHQVYKGYLSNTFKAIVESTRGVVIAWQNRPILAMFAACCGGVIPARISGFDFTKAPYLARTYPCHYCRHHHYYSWQAVFTCDEIERALKKEYKKLSGLKDIELISDKAGLVSKVKLKSGLVLTVPGTKVKLLLKTLRSRCFSLERKGSRITVKGKGYGHHMGLCQWGACQMVKEGWTYRSILQFYYPGATLMKLKTVEKPVN